MMECDASAHFSYQHQEEWSKIYPYCGRDDESPIDVRTADISKTCLASFEWDFIDHQMFEVKNDNHSVKFVAVEKNELGYTTLNQQDNTIATFPDYFAPAGSEHTTFCLDSFHIHFGMKSDFGSEHLIDGAHYPLEMHFVHFACDMGSFENAMDEETFTNDADPHLLGVVTVFFEVGDTNNAAFDTILTNNVVKKLNNINLGECSIADNLENGCTIVDNLDVSSLIPSTVDSDGYYYYEGSLTTPPCYDIVRWHLMKATSTISESQLEKLRTLRNSAGDPLGGDYRDIQSNVNGVWDCSLAGSVDSDDSEGEDSSDESEDESILAVELRTHQKWSKAFIFVTLVAVFIFVTMLAMTVWYAQYQKAVKSEIQYETDIDVYG